MKKTIIKGMSDLGLHINGTDKGPDALNDICAYADNVITLKKDNVEKELDKDNKKKNIKYINKFNNELYNTILNEENFVITIGGDHSIAIGSALASSKKFKDEAIFWIDAHSDYHNMASTISGNIHGMPLCTITGQNSNDLSEFFDGNYIDPNKCVIIGARDIEKPEYVNLEKAGVHVFTTQDIKEKGVESVMNEAYNIIKDTTSLHISYDLDVIDPKIAPGVSVKAIDGITEEEAYQIMDEILKRKEILKSFDLVELNPDNDINNTTRDIAYNLLLKLIKNI